MVLVCWGSHGDLFPYLGLAAGLKARGHEPVVATCESYRSTVQSIGVEFHPMRPDVDPGNKPLVERIMDPRTGTEVVVRELLVPALRGAYADLDAIRPRPDLFVSHPVTFAVQLVAESRGVPWISTVLAPASFFSLHDFPLLPPFPRVMSIARRAPWIARAFMSIARRTTGPWLATVRAFRAELGLPDGGDPLYEGQFSPRGTLALFSRALATPQADWPAHTTQTGFVFYNTSPDLDPQVDAFLRDGDPPIVFTLGSSAVTAAGTFYTESVEAAAMVGRRALLLAGENEVTRAPAHKAVMTVASAPHAAVFPRAAVTVHHGGVGTTGQALRAGRPMIVVPHAHDQPDNAARVERLGIGRTIDAGSYTAPRVAAALRALLDDRAAAEKARDVAAIIASEDGVAAACDAIERVTARV